MVRKQIVLKLIEADYSEEKWRILDKEQNILDYLYQSYLFEEAEDEWRQSEIEFDSVE